MSITNETGFIPSVSRMLILFLDPFRTILEDPRKESENQGSSSMAHDLWLESFLQFKGQWSVGSITVGSGSVSFFWGSCPLSSMCSMVNSPLTMTQFHHFSPYPYFLAQGKNCKIHLISIMSLPFISIVDNIAHIDNFPITMAPGRFLASRNVLSTSSSVLPHSQSR